MQAPVDIEELKNAIRLAREKHLINRKLLREQFLFTCETLKPGNHLLSTIRDLISGPNLILTKLVVGTALGLTTVLLPRRIVLGTSAIVLRKILAGILQLSAAGILSKNASVPDFFWQEFLTKPQSKKIFNNPLFILK